MSLSPAEEAFAEYLVSVEAGEADFDAFCRARPELAEALRCLNERWVIFDRALSADLAIDDDRFGAGLHAEASAAAAASTDHLLSRLRRTSSEESRYEARGEIGRGGMGRVLKVWDRDLRRSLAMKVLQRRGKRDARSLARFLDEALVTGQLEHPGIVPVHELGLDAEGRVYFTMPFVRGENLQRIFERVRAGEEGWSLARVLDVILRVCEAVGYAHARGVVHRDLKPANIMVGPFGETYVMDWGLARILGESARENLPLSRAAEHPSHDVRSVRADPGPDSSTSPLTTMEGDIVGTPVYMAPEQAHGWIERVGPATDVYSIGAMLYQLLTGSRPYLSPGEEDSSRAVLRAVQSRAPRPIHTLAHTVPQELEAICEKAMSREPKDRYATTMELAADLQAFQQQRVVAAYETGALAELRKWVARNRKLAVAIGAFSLAVLAGLAISTALYFRAKRNEHDALEQQQRADANAADFATQLRRSHLAHGRMTGANGHLEAAEELLWPEHLAHPNDAVSRWLLWELYARFPRPDVVGAPLSPYDMSVTPDGEIVLVTGAAELGGQAELVLFDSKSLARVATIPVGTREPQVASDSEGRRVLTAGGDGEVRLWDLLTRREVARFATLPAAVRDIVHHAPTDAWVLACGDGVVRVLDRDGGLVGQLAAPAAVSALALSDDGALLASGCDDGSIQLWRALGAEPVHAWKAHGRAVLTLAFTPNGERLFAGSRDFTASQWDVATAERVAVLKPENGSIGAISAGADGLLAVSGWDRIDLLDAETLEVRRSFASSSDVRRLVRPALDRLVVLHVGTLVAWDLHSERQTLRFSGAGGRLACDYSDDGRLLIGDGTGLVQDIDPAAPEHAIEWNEGGRISALAAAPGGRDVAVVVEDEVRIRDRSTGELRSSFGSGYAASEQRLAFSPDGRWIAAVGESRDEPFALHAVDTGERVSVFGRAGEEQIAVTFSPTGEFIATVTRTHTDSAWLHWVSLWSPAGEELARIQTNLSWKLDVSPDGKRVATGQWGRDPEVWDLASGMRVAVLRGHTGHAWSVDWHPRDPNVLASCSDDGTLRLWNTETGEPLLIGESFGAGRLLWVRFGPDGRTLASSGFGSDAIVWDLSYFDRHIAGNARFQASHRATGDLPPELSAWSEEVLARPWPRFARRGGERR